ncbi:fumarylacetoacetate hydrolase family protein [Amorphoplanes digitatis]|uniref:fumarylacetoacetate hydrolase family protein n=1 Tax=Actinoplanes digitatis TaxID=1868 RepID=UPI001941E840|nr:fumarylacetoacetate hydrolase family protein [Actinoplanes digitatis]GID94921.1 fumarylacetoacetase [Actinoplanes digitatis]
MTLFDLRNLPYGVFSGTDGVRRIGVRLGDAVLDLSRAESAELILAGGALRQPSLNVLMSLGRPQWTAVRARVVELAPTLPAVPLTEVELHLPFEVADYADFYSSEHHATNVSRILRPDRPGLQPNWRHLPVGYHGRAGTVVVSGTPIGRPAGQLGPGDFGPTRRLDVEAEVGFVVGLPGSRIRTTDFAEHVFGVVLVNDWSARDIQAFEYLPLGPFLGKSFATSVSPWVVPLEALAGAFVPAAAQHPAPAGYLTPPGDGLNLSLTVEWNGTPVSSPPFAQMYWTPAQQLAHLTVNGAGVRTGDLYASGTVSGPARGEAGSFLELTWNGSEPVKLDDGSTRGFLLDGDTVTISATAPGPDGRPLGLGAVSGTVCR